LTPAHEHRWERGSTAAWRRLRERVIREQRGRCGSRPPTLYVHHRDGDARNDRRSNLEALCPRCHLAAHR